MTANPVSAQEQNPESYIILHRKGTPDILVSEKRTDKGLNWYETHKILNEEGFFMPTLSQFSDFLNLLQSSKRLYDGTGKKLSTTESDQRKARILDDILAQRGPWRAEHLDAHFLEFESRIYMSSNHRTIDGKLEYLGSVPLEKCVMKDCYVDLTGMNGQGLPTKKSTTQKYNQGKYIYFWSPNANSVAGFVANSDWVGLYCDGDAQFSVTGLGVRRQKFFEK